MLDLEILKTDYGVSYGSVTLKSLQNDNVPELDLLVREAIQNSSDASLKEAGASYNVNFLSGHFIPSEFNTIMSGLEDVLNLRFSGPSAPFLEIRDTKTSGLTGQIRKADIKKDDHGNFFKLIYDTGKRQTISTAGGNWGFGKSVYYRVGIGIVIFYSRIQTPDGAYENRMIITLVEDESKTDSAGNDATLLNDLEPLSAGKAWWGYKDGEDLLPLTDMEIITPILEIFGIKPFNNNETGTSIIIPYVNTDKLLNGIIPVDAEIEEAVKSHYKEVWASSISDYLRLSIQKWYAPKIHNRELPKFCNNKWLLVTVDNKPIRKAELLPFFRLTQELYTTALAKSYQYDYESEAFPEIETLPIKVRNYFDNGTTIGYVSLIRVNKARLNGTQNVLSPYDYIGKFEADGGLNEPIVMYSRDPGMVIDYAITGAWVKNLTPPDDANEFLFAFFVPTTEKRIKNDLGVPEYAGMRLGEYLRECEASDHMGWADPVKMQIVHRIQTNVINGINKHIKASLSDNGEATPSKLSNKLGRNLLPRIGYGKRKKSGSGSGSGGNGVKLHNISFVVTSHTIKSDEAVIEFVLSFAHGKKEAAVSLMIASEAGWIDATSWKEEIGTPFPVGLSELSIDTLKDPLSDQPTSIGKKVDSIGAEIATQEVQARLIDETGQGNATQFSVSPGVRNPEVTGTIRMKSFDRKYQFSFKVE